MEIQEAIILVMFLGVRWFVGHSLKIKDNRHHEDRTANNGCCTPSGLEAAYTSIHQMMEKPTILGGAWSWKGPCCLGHTSGVSYGISGNYVRGKWHVKLMAC